MIAIKIHVQVQALVVAINLVVAVLLVSVDVTNNISAGLALADLVPVILVLQVTETAVKSLERNCCPWLIRLGWTCCIAK